MKDDFFAGLFEQARKTANDLLDKGEGFLRDVEAANEPSDELEKLRFANEALSERVTELQDLNEEFANAILVMLDGEVQKEFTMTWTKYYNMLEADLEVFITDDTSVTPGEVTITIRQER